MITALPLSKTTSNISKVGRYTAGALAETRDPTMPLMGTRSWSILVGNYRRCCNTAEVGAICNAIDIALHFFAKERVFRTFNKLEAHSLFRASRWL